MVWILVASEWICLQHSILVWSVFSSLISLIGLCLAWNNWLFLLTTITCIGLPMIGVPASSTLQPRLLLSFIFLDTIDIISKTYLTLDLIIWRRKLRTNCIDARRVTCDCTFDNCRVILLDSINGIIFLTISCIINLLLLISAIHLYIFIRKCLKSLLKRAQAQQIDQSNNQSDYRPSDNNYNRQQSQSSLTDSYNRVYGTFNSSFAIEYSNESTL